MPANELNGAFACHNSKDKDVVRGICRGLDERRDVSVWFDERDIEFGDEFWEEIATAIRSSDVHLVFLGPHGLGKVQRKEIGVILTQDKCIIPIVLPGANFDEVVAQPKEDILLWLGGVRHAVDLTAGVTDTVLDRLAATIKRAEPPTPEELRQRVLGRQQLGIQNLPPRNHFFTGREKELRQIEEQLSKSSLAVLSGFGGTGKTATAVEFAYREGSHYRHQLWTLAEEPSDLIGGFTGIARLLGLVDEQESDSDLAVQATTRWLADTDGWLLILDNADSNKMLEFVAQHLPNMLRGHVIVTTRRDSAEPLADYGVAQLVEIVDLLPADAVEFLARRTERQFDANEYIAAENLAHELGFLAIALEQAAAYLLRHGNTVDDYLAAYRRRSLELQQSLLDEIAPQTGGRRSRPLATTWLMNFEEVQKASEASADLLRLLAYLHPDAIPQELIFSAAKVLGGALANALPDGDLIALNTVLEPLRRYSLIRRDRASHTLSIHRMVQSVLLATIEQSSRFVGAKAAVRVVASSCPGYGFENWPALQRWLPHALETAAWIKQYHIESKSAAYLLKQAGVYLYDLARYDEAEPLCQRSLAITEMLAGPEHPDIAESLYILACLYSAQGKYDEAEPLYQRSLAIWENVLGPEHPNVADSLYNLALLYYAQGKYDEAEPLYQRSLAIRENVLGPEHPDVADSTSGLAWLYSAQGKYDEAEPLYQRSLAIREQVLGPEHPDVADSLENYAALLRELDRSDEAKPLEDRARQIRSNRNGGSTGSSGDRGLAGHRFGCRSDRLGGMYDWPSTKVKRRPGRRHF